MESVLSITSDGLSARFDGISRSAAVSALGWVPQEFSKPEHFGLQFRAILSLRHAAEQADDKGGGDGSGGEGKDNGGLKLEDLLESRDVPRCQFPKGNQLSSARALGNAAVDPSAERAELRRNVARGLSQSIVDRAWRIAADVHASRPIVCTLGVTCRIQHAGLAKLQL